MTVLAYIQKILDATAGFRVGRTGKVKKPGQNYLEMGFGSALQELVITSLTRRMECLMKARGCWMILMNFILIC
jgi:hypothetical protein